jgi:BirA family biotin operon repressor/biotin-[acetyl-CoA-carboxylase] ligase
LGNIVLNSERFGSQIVFISECESTNDIALEYLREFKPSNPIIFITDHQTKGRGQRGNTWVAEKGSNLTFSILWFPNQLLITNQFLLNQLSSLAIAKTITELGAKNVKVKWPNDVYVADEKIAGILIENLATGKHIKASVMGIGLNINQKAVKDIKMISLSELVKLKISKETICEKLIKNLDYFLDAVENKSLEINSFYESNLYAFQIPTVFRNQKGENFVGQIQGIDNQGLLKIDTNNEQLKFAFKEVSLVNVLE